MSHDEMKQKGNECIRQKQYDEAAKYYTLALESNPASHTVYSNRSLAFTKLGRFDAALNDANKCVELSPNFARGYLRKCVALIGLGSYEEAKAAAEVGYKLRGSDAICQDCVMQWLEANQALLKGKIDKCLEEIGLGEDIIPRGCRIISDDYLTIFLNLLLCRLQFTTIGVEMKFVKSCILQLLQELDRILQLFGHTPHTCANEWLTALCLASTTNPSTSRVPHSIVAKLLDKSKEFSLWLDMEVDHALYPIIRPLMCLIVIGAVARCISLNVLNSEQHVTQVTCQACLPFFEASLLSTPEYMEQHIGIYKELLESYGTSNFVFTDEEIQFGKQSITKLEALLECCPTSKHTKTVNEKAMISIALAQIRLGQSPGFDPVAFAAEGGKAVSQAGKTEPEKLRAYVRKKQQFLKNALEVPPDTVGSTLMEFTYEDIQDLLWCIGGLLEIDEKEMAVEVFQLAESGYVRMFQQQIKNEAFNLDEAASAFHTPQTIVFQTTTSFLGTEDQLVADTVVKWKCLYSELRAILIRLGVGKRYAKTFQAIQELEVRGQVDQHAFMKLAEQHQHETNEIMVEKSQFVVTCLLKQSCEQIRSLLLSDQLILEYCVEREEYIKAADYSSGTPPTGVLVIIRPEGEPIVTAVDFKKVLLLARKWSQWLCDPGAQKEAKAAARTLCELLIPQDVQVLIDHPNVKRVFICPDVSLAVLPLELLLFEDGMTLGEKWGIAYLSSAREILRDLVVSTVSITHILTSQDENKESSLVEAKKDREGSIQHKEKEHNEALQCKSSVEEKVDVENSASQNDKQHEGNAETTLIRPKNTNLHGDAQAAPEELISNKCIIIAAPNYDLQKAAESGIWESVFKAFGLLFSKPIPDLPLVKPLPQTEEEAKTLAEVLSNSGYFLKVSCLIKDKATVLAALQIESPFILHFSTHGFSHPDARGYRGSFWDDTKCGLLLAGANTYRVGKLTQVSLEAGSGELTSLAVCGMNLQGTRLVYLSTCMSSYGLYSYGESVGSLAQAFRSAGAQTVIATQWAVVDDTARQFAVHFYEAAYKTAVPPSQALTYAKEKIRQESPYKHWAFWSAFICIGEDLPLFS